MFALPVRHRRNRSHGQTAPIEALETRALLAGDVAAMVSGGDLVIKGDRAANEVEVTVLDGDIVVQGLNGTTINGAAEFIAFAGTATIPDDLQMRMDEGSDRIVLSRGLTVSDEINIDLSGGANTVSVLDVTAGRLRIRGDGANSIQLLEDAVITGDVSIKMRGKGSDTIVVRGASVGDDLVIRGGDGLNTTLIVGATVSDDLHTRGGEHQDDVVVRNSTVRDDVSVKVRRGDDFVMIEDSDITDKTRVNLGRGDDHLIVGDDNSFGSALFAHGKPDTDRRSEGSGNTFGKKRYRSFERTSVAENTLTERLDGEQGVNTRAAAADDALDELINATLTLTIEPVSFGEGSGNAAIGQVTTTRVPSRDLVVTLTSSDSTAATTPGTVTIPAGSTTAVFDVTAIDDNSPDGTQTATITATAERHSSASVDLEVTDDDTLTLTIDTATLDEADGSATATVTRGSTTDVPLVVTITTSDSTEVAVPATVTIPVGASSATFSVDAVDDATPDGDQTVTVEVSEAGHTGDSVSVMVIDDDLLTLTIDETSFSESDTTTEATATLTRLSSTAAPLEVTITADATEINAPAMVTIPAGESSVTFIVTSVDDTEADGDQDVTITASETGHSSASVDVSVSDDDILELAIDNSEFSEGDGGTVATATLTRQSSTAADLVVTITTDDTEVGVPATVTIPAGEESVTFDVSAVDDAEPDGNQTVTITASEAGHQSASVDVTVTDNEVLTLTIDATAISEGDGDGAATATVTRLSDTSSELTVSVISSDETAATVPENVTIPAGETSVSFPVDAVDDNIDDGVQFVTLTATAANHSDGTTNLEVLDDDVLTLTINVGSISEGDGPGAAIGTVTRQSQPVGDLLVTLINSDGSEIEIPGTVTIPAGETSATFNIDAVNDSEDDGTQRVIITATEAGHTGASAALDVTDTDDLIVTVANSTVSESEGVEATIGTVSRQGDVSEALTITLTSSDTTELTVTTSIEIPAGEASVSFPVDTVDDDDVDLTQTVTITAAAAGFADATVDVDVLDDDARITLTIDPNSISEVDGTATATLTRNSDATDALNVALSSSSDDVTIPSGTSFEAGETTATFTIDAIDDALRQGNRDVTITATASLHQDGIEDITIEDDDSSLTVTITDDFVGEAFGDAATTATVTRDSITDDPLTVDLTSSNRFEASVPESVTIPAGETSVTFDIDVHDDENVDGPRAVDITATGVGHNDGVDTITVNDDDSINITLFTPEGVEPGFKTLMTRNPNLVIEGATAPNQVVNIDTNNDHVFDDGSVTADSAGFFSYTTSLTNDSTNFGSNTVEFETTDNGDESEAGLAIHLAVGSVVRFLSNTGFFDVELLDADAPNTVANFKNYLERYEDSIVHRSPEDFVVQGGGFVVDGNTVEAIDTDPPIANEFDPANSNLEGTLSMALRGGNPNSGDSQWFLNVVDNPFLDAAMHTVFGRVIGEGMEVVEGINSLDIFNLTDLTGQSALAETPLRRQFPDPIDGTVSATAGTSIVTGTSTSFLTEVQVGDFVRLDGDILVKVTAVESDTQLRVAATFQQSLSAVELAVQQRTAPDAAEYVVFSSIEEILDEL